MKNSRSLENYMAQPQTPDSSSTHRISSENHESTSILHERRQTLNKP
jgi:hypothetical protein